MSDTDTLAAILAKHEGIDEGVCDGCICGVDLQTWKDHRAHVASMILESDWLRGVRAKELRDAAQRYIERGVMPGSPSNVSLWLIDRADRVDAEDTDNTTDRT